MPLSLLFLPLLFALVSVGVAWPVVARLGLSPSEKLVSSVGLSLLAAFLVEWAIYVFALPAAAIWLLPVMAAGGVAFRWPELRGTWRDDSVRVMAAGQVLVLACSLGWMATIASYSGGGWAGDWYEHWERTRVYLERWPLDSKFLEQYALTARPPLVNVVTAAFLSLTRVDYVHFQIVITLLAAASFLPAALLALRWGGARAVSVLAVLAMVNPYFVQNSTFAWTKFPAAFFVLIALYFFLRARDPDSPGSAPVVFAASLAAGILAHYSAGPYALLLAGAWIFVGVRRRRDRAWWSTTSAMAAVCVGLLATWFGWAFATYGVSGTLLTNTSVTAADARSGNQLVKMGLNLLDTLIPHFLRPMDRSLITQSSPWGWLRDWFFQCYQLNLPLAFGSLAWLAIGRELLREAKTASRPDRIFWGYFIAGLVVLGTAASGERDHWGLAHICLHALVLIGLAFLAACWPRLGSPWRIALILGGAFDLMFGIVLHFGVQSFALDRWLAPGKSLQDVFEASSYAAKLNLLGKLRHQVVFLSDALAPPFVLVAVAELLVLGLALRRAMSSAIGRPGLSPIEKSSKP